MFAGRYRMIARIGRGGMGDVWRADDLVLETPVALKLIDSTGPAARARILNEVRLARQITHPGGLPRVRRRRGRAASSSTRWSWCDGEDLAALLRRVGRLPSEKVIDIARQLCAGLAAAHAQGVLHRDLKPANVLIDDDGRVRITDFGIAIPRDDGRAAHADRHAGLHGARAADRRARTLSERTDIYALGLVLYELLVGQHPFNDRSSRTAEPPRPSSLVPTSTRGSSGSILQALSRRPDAIGRQSAAAMVGSLADDGRRPADCRPARGSRPWSIVGGRRWCSPSIVAALVVAVSAARGRAAR